MAALVAVGRKATGVDPPAHRVRTDTEQFRSLTDPKHRHAANSIGLADAMVRASIVRGFGCQQKFDTAHANAEPVDRLGVRCGYGLPQVVLGGQGQGRG
nr:hypothetical protein Ade03nite_12580 [Actinoplanes derwentensis]